VSVEKEGLTGVDGNGFVDGVREEEAPVLDGHSRLTDRQVLSVQIDYADGGLSALAVLVRNPRRPPEDGLGWRRRQSCGTGLGPQSGVRLGIR